MFSYFVTVGVLSGVYLYLFPHCYNFYYKAHRRECAFLQGGWAVSLSFPPGFKFGAATAAYQIEGAWNVSDKSESIWDRYTHEHRTSDGSTGDVACDSYRLWERDIEIAANMSLDFYRFSIAWTRLLPTGFPNYISKDGTEYYNKLIDGLLAKGIEPVVTLYHWDLPQRLQDLGGWTNPLISDWFADYADVAFRLFGSRVKTWITINEPLIFCDATYSAGFPMAPGIIDPDVGIYLCGKHAFLAHAKAYHIYQKKYRSGQHGLLSFANQAPWLEGVTEEDEELAEIANQYTLGRHAHPVYSKEGGWPAGIEKYIAKKSIREGYLSSRLPEFTEEEKTLVRGTYDFFALNHYTSRVVRQARPGEVVAGYPLTGAPELGIIFEKRPEWSVATSQWLFIYPEGLRLLLKWVKDQYGDIPIFISENGYSSVGRNLNDQDRIDYYKRYLEQVLLSIHEDGVNVIGYTAWSLIDNFEWMDGYNSKFGLWEVDFTDAQRTRTIRRSGQFYSDVIARRSLDLDTHYTDEL